MRGWLTVTAGGATCLLAATLVWAPGPEAALAQEAPPGDAAVEADDDAGHGEPAKGCGGCSKPHDYVGDLAPEEFDALVERFATEPLEPGSEALERLLFHHEDGRRYLHRAERPALDPQREAFLARELGRTHAVIGFRVIDEEGRERMRVDPTPVPLGAKQHLPTTATDDVQPASFNGTVVRVGLDHLWTRY